MNQSKIPRPSSAVGRSERVALTVAVVCSACALIAGMIISPAMTSHSPDHCGTRIALVFPFLLALIPHLDILARLWREKPQKGIVLALAMGSVGFVVAFLTLTPLVRNVWQINPTTPLLVAIAQAAVLITAGRMYAAIRWKS